MIANLTDYLKIKQLFLFSILSSKANNSLALCYDKKTASKRADDAPTALFILDSSNPAPARLKQGVETAFEEPIPFSTVNLPVSSPEVALIQPSKRSEDPPCIVLRPACPRTSLAGVQRSASEVGSPALRNEASS
jgi:hypothetical protein